MRGADQPPRLQWHLLAHGRPLWPVAILLLWAAPYITQGGTELGKEGPSVDPPAIGATPVSRFGKLTSQRWAYGLPYVRECLTPVPNPSPEPQPKRSHPYDLAITPDGTKVYVGLAGSELQPGSQVVVYDVGQEFLSEKAKNGQLVIGGTMTVPQMRGLFAIQPFFLEGVISAFEPRSMIMEHAPADDFVQATP